MVRTALASSVIVAVLAIVAGALTPGYSHMSQFISELGATGAPYSLWVRFGGFLPAGVLLLVFCVTALRVLPRTRDVVLGMLGLALYSGGYLVAVAFPCDPGCRPQEPSTSQLIHNAGGLIGYLVAPAFLFMLARAARAWPGSAMLVTAGYTASAVALVGLVTLTPSSVLVGVSQRALELAVLGWVVLLGIYLARLDGRQPGK